MKPASRDVRHGVTISGVELRELKRLTGAMAESLGLDRRIDEYQGKRPIQLYRWDLDCLVTVLEDAMREAPSGGQGARGRALRSLHTRIHGLWESAYEELA